DLEPDDPVDLLAERREHHDRDIRARAQLAANLETALVRQHEVEDDQVEARALERAPRLLAIGYRRGLETVLLEIVAQQRAYLAIVVDDENVGRVAHANVCGVHPAPMTPGRAVVTPARATIRVTGRTRCNELLAFRPVPCHTLALVPNRLEPTARARADCRAMSRFARFQPRLYARPALAT